MGSPSAVAGWERIQLERAEAWRAYRSHSRKGLHVKGSSSRGRKETRQASTAPHPLLFQVTMVRTPLGRGRRSQSQVGASASHILSVQEEAWLLRGQATRVHQEAQYSPCTTAEGPGQGRAGWWPPGRGSRKPLPQAGILLPSAARLLTSCAGSRQLCHVHTAPCQAGAPTGLLRALVSKSCARRAVVSLGGSIHRTGPAGVPHTPLSQRGGQPPPPRPPAEEEGGRG